MIKHYETWIRFYRKHPSLIPVLVLFNKIVTLTGYITYPGILFFLFIKKSSLLIPYIMIPGLAFLLVSFFRKMYNRPRPYENPNIHTLTRRNKTGQSFPSRHVFSYSLISVLLYSLFPIPGILMMILTLILAYLRVILGVHYPSDVMAGAFLGIMSGILTTMIHGYIVF